MPDDDRIDVEAAILPRVTITYVHGTWPRLGAFLSRLLTAGLYRASSSWFIRGSEFRVELEARLAKFLYVLDDASAEYSWTGANSLQSRTASSRSLVQHVRNLEGRYPGSTHLIVAHSHGGNVATEAMLQLQDLEKRLALVSIATPFVRIMPTSPRRIANWLQFSSVLAMFSAIWVFAIANEVMTEWLRSPGGAELLASLHQHLRAEEPDLTTDMTRDVLLFLASIAVVGIFLWLFVPMLFMVLFRTALIFPFAVNATARRLSSRRARYSRNGRVRSPVLVVLSVNDLAFALLSWVNGMHTLVNRIVDLAVQRGVEPLAGMYLIFLFSLPFWWEGLLESSIFAALHIAIMLGAAISVLLIFVLSGARAVFGRELFAGLALYDIFASVAPEGDRIRVTNLHHYGRRDGLGHSLYKTTRFIDQIESWIHSVVFIDAGRRG